MAITKVGSSSAVAGTSISVDWPAGHQAGDIAFIALAKNATGTHATPSGWTLEHNQNASNTTGTVRLQVFSRVATGSSEASVSLSDGNNIIASMVVYRGIDPTTPIQAVGAGVNSTSGTTMSVPAVTTANADSLVLLFAGSERDVAGAHFSTVSNANLSSITTEVNDGTTTGNGSGLLIASGIKATAGSTGTTSITKVSSGETTGVAIVLNPNAISQIVGDTSFSMVTSNPVITGAGALLAAATMALSPGGTIGANGALVGSTGMTFGNGNCYLLGTHDAAGSGTLAINSGTSTLGGVLNLVGNTTLSLSPSATGVAQEGASATTSLQLTTQGVLAGAGALLGSTGAFMQWQGDLTASAYANGVLPVNLTTSGAITGAGALIGSSGLSLVPGGTLAGSTSLSGSLGTMALSPNGALLGSGRLLGSISKTWSQTGAITGAGALLGNIPVSITTAGGMGGETPISAEATFSMSLSPAELRGAGRLIGTTNGLFSLLGTGNGYVDMAGNASLTLIPQGTLQAVFNPIFGNTWNAKWAAVFTARQALLNAAAAQARGLDDGYVDTFFDTGAPYTAAVADLWREQTTGTLYRWNGTTWDAEPELMDGTADETLTSVLVDPANIAAIADGRIRTYWADEAPAIGGGGASEGDVWFDTDDGTQQLIWDGLAWVATSSGATIYAQNDAPTAGMKVGDLWIDTNDGNKLYRWDGDAWVDVGDDRIDAAAAAVTELLSRVSATEDLLDSQAASITSLSGSLSDTQGDLDALATANEALTIQVTSIAGSKATVFAQATAPSSTGRVNGDLWIDTDDGNRIYVWDGAWTLRPVGVTVFAQATEPTSVGRLVGDLWFDTDDNNRQYRWNGSAWMDITDQRIISQASQITTLQSQVALLPAVYVQDTAPTGSTYAVGDIWFDSDDGNKQYIWNGTIWDDTATVSGAIVYAQTAEPTGGAYNVGDLWIDLDDGNRMYRWNGAAWIDVSDQRMVGQASAIEDLTTRVEATEGAISSQASQITTLNSSVAAKTRTFVQASAPTATAIGDVWIDTDDGNKFYAWNGTIWELRRLDAGASTYAQNDPPATGVLGDLWVDTNDSNKLYRWDGSAWVLLADGRIASQGTAISDLTTRTETAEGLLATHTSQITSLNASLSTKPRIYADPSQPTGAVVGDLWIDTDDSNKLYTWNGTSWIYRAIPTGAKVYRQASAPGTGNIGDLWFDSDDGNKPYIWTGSAWTDNTDARTAANASAISTLNATVAQKNQTLVQGTAPGSTGRVVGDIWIDTSNGNLLMTWNGSAWVARADANKIKTYAQNDAPTGGTYAIGDIWIDTNDNNLLYRWNGSNWVLVADVRISAQASQITALTSEVAGKATVAALNALTTRVLTIEAEYGVNLLLNPGLVVDARNWVASVWNSADRSQWSHGRDHLGAGYQIAGTHNFGISYAGTNTTANEYYVTYGDKFPMEAGVLYGFQALLSMVELGAVDVALEAFNAAGTYIGDLVSLYNDQTTWTGGTNRANWRAMSAQFTSYAGTTHAHLRFRVRTKTNGVNPRAHVTEAMLEKMAPGAVAVSPFNFGSSASWAEWNLTFNVNGHVSGIQYGNDGRTSNFTVDADVFEVKSTRSSNFLSWTNGKIWNKGTDFSVMLGQDMTPDEDVIMWIGPNPVSPEAALKADAAFFITEAGDAVFRGTVSQSLLTGSAMELGSTRIHTGGGRLAPFTIRDFGYKAEPAGGSNFSATVTLADFQSPDVGTGYHHKRFSRKKADVVLTCTLHGDGGGGESVYIEVQYDGGTWQPILSRTNINVDYRGGFTLLVRYTTAETWNTVSFRARTTNANTICLAFAATIDNTFETGNAAGSNSGLDATAGGGGAPPAGGGGGGTGEGGGSFCLVADSTFLPEGGMLQDARLGTQILCWDGQLEEPGLELHALRKKPFGYEEAFLVQAENGAQVKQSASTPTPVRTGEILRADALLGQEVLTNINGALAWSQVVLVEPLGVRRVVKPDVGDRILFAGTTPSATIATHNLRDKDLEP